MDAVLTPPSPPRCPDCALPALVPVPLAPGAEGPGLVGLCPSCGGVAVAGSAASPDLEADTLPAAATLRTCPQGHGSTHPRALPALSGAVLDVCPVCRDLWIPGTTRRALLREVGPAARDRRRALAGHGVTWVAQLLLRMPIVLGDLRLAPPWRLLGVAAALIAAYVASVLGLVYAREWALVPAPHGVDPTRAHTLLTHVFFHTDWYHILGNLYFFYMFGRAVEHALGGARFLFVFFSAGVIGGLAQALFAPASAPLVLGASGAIAGVMGAHLWIYPKNRVLQVLPFVFVQVEIPAWVYLCLWLFGQLSLAATMYALDLAWCSHVTGFLYGVAAAALAVRLR